jgi:SAM-dependent methyltransferase
VSELRETASLAGLVAGGESGIAPGLSLAQIPANPAKIQLILDLANLIAAAPGRLRVLDIGIGGRYAPFSLWEPLAPLASRLDLYGIDIAHLQETESRAAELDFPVKLAEQSADHVVETFGTEFFDAVVSTQVLEHLPRWQEALGQMASALRSGGKLYVTCDSGDRALMAGTQLRLAAKRWYARAANAEPGLKRLGGRFLSGDWEQAPRLDDVHDVVERLGLTIETLRHFGLRDLKTLQNRLDATGRVRWLDLELQIQSGDPSLFLLLYLRATKPLDSRTYLATDHL